MRWTIPLTALALALGTGAQANSTLSGEYLEARTCNVYTGACHANGEVVTAGREAMLVWNIKSGQVDGVKLDGVRAVAIVVGRDNLATCGTGCGDRKTVLYVDDKATLAQREALAWVLDDRFNRVLGRIAAIKSAPIQFDRKGNEYTVAIPGVARLTTTRYDCDHCVMPHQVWYKPFIELKSHIVAKAAISEFRGTPELATRWLRTDENSSFVGEFAF